MIEKQLRSRILEFFPLECIVELNELKRNKRIYNNNDKIVVAINILDKYKLDYIKIGTGTNRLAILTDNYIFKIAMDDEGIRDNRNEFVMSKINQPHVLKVYENNNIISVSEYATLISLEEFIDRSYEIEDILEDFSNKYLFGDLGVTKKNFQNWGYRDDGTLIAVDFAYMYPIDGTMLLCKKCGHNLRYTSDYTEFRCTKCGSMYTFWDIRKGIDMNRIDKFIAEELSYAPKVNKARTKITQEEYIELMKMNIPYDSKSSEGLYTNNGEDILQDFLKSAGISTSYGNDKYIHLDMFNKFSKINKN